MQSARTTLHPKNPPSAVPTAIDWARDDHAVSVVDARAAARLSRTIEHSAAGLREQQGEAKRRIVDAMRPLEANEPGNIGQLPDPDYPDEEHAGP